MDRSTLSLWMSSTAIPDALVARKDIGVLQIDRIKMGHPLGHGDLLIAYVDGKMSYRRYGTSDPWEPVPRQVTSTSLFATKIEE